MTCYSAPPRYNGSTRTAPAEALRLQVRYNTAGGRNFVSQRILLLLTDLEIGGTPTVVRELAIRLNDPPNVLVEVACLSKWGPIADQLRNAGIEVRALGAAGVRDLGAIRRAIKLIRERRFDTVFSFLIHAN